MAAGWAVALDAPFGWTKQVPPTSAARATAWSCTGRRASRPRNEVRTQFSHVIDVAPTMLEAAGLPEPKSVNGTPQIPMEGTSMVYTFADAKAKERHTTQYFEIAGNRAIYHDGWFARTSTRPPGSQAAPRCSRTTPPGSSTTRATTSAWPTTSPRRTRQKLAELQDLFLPRLRSTTCCRSTTASFERLNAKLAGRPDLMGDRTSLTLAEGMTGMMENVFSI
jgi:arylsulfatase A-like enzyme